MNLEMKSVCLLFFLLTLFRTSSDGQEIREDAIHPIFGFSGRSIENRISLDMPDTEYEDLCSITGEKVGIHPGRIMINGDTLNLEEIGTRGQSTLMYKRKSLNIKLYSKATFRHGEREESLKKFYLLSLSMDKYYCRNRFAFEMMDTLGLFKLFYAFCELRINGGSEGIFLILEQPEDWALKGQKSPLILRRGYDHNIDKIKAEKGSGRNGAREYLDYYKLMYKSLKKYEGEELHQELLKYIDLDFYMRWLAFNFLIHNGDYSDEVFFYFDPHGNRFRIIPWDYDDILAASPHEGEARRNKYLGDKLIFSSEDLLDKKIASDPFLYGVYLNRLKEVLETLSPETMKQAIEHTYAELYPYYSDPEIISNAQFDCYKDACLAKLMGYLSRMHFFLSGSRTDYLDELASTPY